MEQTEIKDLPTESPLNLTEKQNVSPACSPKETAVSPQVCPHSKQSTSESNDNGKAELTYIYAMGKIEPRFPTLALEKEFAQVTGRTETKGLTDWQTFHSVLSKRENRYLLRQMCWVMSIEGLETYILHPRDPSDLDLLLETIRTKPSREDLDVVIGIKGPIAPSRMCNGLVVPIVAFDLIYAFDIDGLVKSIPRPEKTVEKEFEPAAKEFFERIMQIADNAGATDEHRALNYLAVRYKAIYAMAAEAFGRNLSLTNIEVMPSRLSIVRKVMDVVFTFTNRATDVDEKFFVRVDVTEEFPFLITKISPYFER